MTASRLTCDHCAEVIGVYEPAIVVSDGAPRETSRAAEPTVASEPGERYHRACYFGRFDGRSPNDGAAQIGKRVAPNY